MIRVNLEKLKKLDFKTNEVYKILRTNISFCGDDIHVIAVTSCSPNEGKSGVSFNLACAMADAGNRVIFVDADLRKSVIAGRYKASKAASGLSHYLCGQCTLEEVICVTNIENMSMIFSGPVPPNPAELLGNQYFADMIDLLKEEYDYVVIDTPPLGSVIDSALVAKFCDGAILVIAANLIHYKFAQNVKEQLDKTGCRILGCVLNKVNMSSKGYYGSYYKGNYGRYYGNYGYGEYENSAENQNNGESGEDT